MNCSFCSLKYRYLHIIVTIFMSLQVMYGYGLGRTILTQFIKSTYLLKTFTLTILAKIY